jgi:limonene-1,2-epoxide hydrolase
MPSPLNLAHQFFAAWNNRDFATIIAAFDDGAVYHNVPMKPIEGRDAIEAYLTPVMEKCSEIDWKILAIAEDPDGRVLSERLDRLKMDGVWIEIPVMGVLEFKEQKISLWRDYFDLRDYENQKIRLGVS